MLRGRPPRTTFATSARVVLRGRPRRTSERSLWDLSEYSSWPQSSSCSSACSSVSRSWQSEGGVGGRSRWLKAPLRQSSSFLILETVDELVLGTKTGASVDHFETLDGETFSEILGSGLKLAEIRTSSAFGSRPPEIKADRSALYDCAFCSCRVLISGRLHWRQSTYQLIVLSLWDRDQVDTIVL